MATDKKPFKVLCIDGGGIKGLYSAQVLAKFEETFNTTVAEQFDLVCGTSTGGIIALAASAGIPIEDVVYFYEKSGPRIFTSCVIKSLLLKLKQALLCSKYSNKKLHKALTEVFGGKKLKESKTLLCIPAYNVSSGQPRVFKKDYMTYTEDDEKTYVDIAMATSAAPTYFPSYKINDQIYADGGLWANNPIQVALIEYLTNFVNDDRFNGLSILSISSCEKPNGETPNLGRGFLSWSKTLFDDYSQGQSFSSLLLLNLIKEKIESLNVNVVRVTNKPIATDQQKAVELDKASAKSLSILKGIGEQTAIEYKMKEEVASFFRTGKTITDIKSFFELNK